MPRRAGTMESYGSLGSSPCEVRIDGADIVISYDDGGIPALYKGREIAPGHFELHSSNGGRATLHQMPGGDRLEGFWVESGSTGMWLIDVDDE